MLSPALFKLKNLEHLDLSANFLSGVIPAELSSLHRLKHLDLSFNYFEDHILKHISSLHNLIYLNLSYAGVDLDGSIQWRLGNISQLQVINLSSRLYIQEESSFFSYYCGPVYSSSLEWTEIVQGLQHLSLQGVELNMTGEQLEAPLSWLHNLRHLNLKDCALSGHVPNALQNLSHLSHLQLGTIMSYVLLVQRQVQNSTNVPPELGGIPSLEVLYLDNNQLNGSIPTSLRCLSRLSSLNLAKNNLEGYISLHFFENATRLVELVLSYNKLTVLIEPEWIPPMQFKDLGLGSCNIGGLIPAFLSTQYSLRYLDLSNNSLFGNIPAWFGDLSTLADLYMSHNNLQGELPSTFDITYYSQIYLDDNMLTGSVPVPSVPASILDVLDLSQNRYTGFIPVEIGSLLPAIQFLLYSQNDLRGDIPTSIGLMQDLQDLDLSDNNFEGKIPPILTNCSALKRLNLANNKLSGEIPSNIGSLRQLEKLHLSDNMLKGNLPFGVQNCSKLQILDVAHNFLSGNIPLWLGQLSDLMILVLRSNKFRGRIPHALGNLSSLHVLDISHNNLTGAIPPELGRFAAIIAGQPGESNVLAGRSVNGRPYYYKEEVNVSNKRLNLAYGDSVLLLITAIDLSSNQLSGDIPSEIGNLKHLHVLNLSGNSLTGEIPVSFGLLEQLESLDLSNNKLHGRIPVEMVQLSFLSFFIVSNNMLCGRIPTGRQFSKFNSTYFSGNPGLCGFPVDKRSCSCEHNSSAGMPPVSQDEEDEEEEEIPWYWYVSWMASFAVGLWGVFGVLCLKKKWRIIYIRVLDGYVDLVDGDPQAGDKPIDAGGENGESRAGDIPRQEPIRRDSGQSWTSLFSVKSSGKSLLPPVRNISDPEKGRFSIEIPNLVIEHNINFMAMTLVGNFLGLRPNIDIVKAFAKCKWVLKGQVEITAMSKGVLSLAFSCKEDMSRVLSDGPWLIGKSMLALQKW
ncbi:LRR receptor-like serine/threonine-protein kinase GSO2 [Cryptomeria japonica]|uniref:LRR receptor-like serine/threonine-protein kinase GSO2 n=1 Tax=Cryptomeria japonica TaxID=3369 RepID=UPI0027DA334D|nr:LRR receptor-like serine/threonine-protein kinase GSO2 [Cryptomeria japonica]